MSDENSLELAVRAVGSQTKLAEAIGRTQQAVSKWAKDGRIPAEYVVAVEKATGIPRQKLRPDLYEGMEPAE